MIPDFNSMTVKELKEYAIDNSINLGEAKKKQDIIVVLNNYYNNKEEVKMEENVYLENEMEANKEVEGNLPENETPVDDKAEDKKDEKRVWHNNKGEEVSMSQFIREKFTEDNMSRKDISERFGIVYRTVYGATVNMENDAESSSRGRGVVNPKIQVTEDGKVLSEVVTPAIEADPENGVEAVAESVAYFLNGEAIAPDENGMITLPETTEIERNTWIKDQVAAGANRGDIAKILDISYGVVYGLTKDEESTRQKYEVEIEDPENPGKTKMIARSEYIRMRVAAGISKSEVAKELGVEYAVVWQATKKEKTDEAKLTDAIRAIEKFTDKMELAEEFKAVVEELKKFELKKEEEKKEEEATEAAETAETVEA